MNNKYYRGFSLIEVLVALAIVAIALTALLKSLSENIHYTDRIKETATQFLVAREGLNLIQLGLLLVPPGQELTESTTLLNEQWYWRVKLQPTGIKNVQQITISVSKSQDGPFRNPIIGFRYHE